MSHPIAGVLASEERTVAWLARKCGLSVSYVWKMLNGERPLTAEFRAAAAEVLGHPESELFADDAITEARAS